MSETTNLLTDAAGRLFADLCTRQTLDAAEQAFPLEMWAQVEESGFPAMLAPEQDGGIGASWSDAVAVMRLAGRWSLPLPLAETMVARWLLARAGLQPVTGPLALALGTDAAPWRLASGKLYGREDAVAWGRDARAILVIAAADAGIAACVVGPGALQIEARRNIAGEPRDRLSADGIVSDAVAHAGQIERDDVLCMVALLRAAQCAGALEALLELCVSYTKERVQFGRPLSRLQAVQQQLAVLAGQVAASAAITEAAAVAAGCSNAKLMVAAARSRIADAIDTATGIAHQVHGAIGFAREYPLHFSTRRLWAWRDEYGAAVQWRETLGRAFAGTPADALWPALADLASR
jgi:acyl-CoA dehydrogenase